MSNTSIEKKQYADVVGPCSHNHEDSCGEYARRVAAGSLETIDRLRDELVEAEGKLKRAGELFREYSARMHEWVRWEQTRAIR